MATVRDRLDIRPLGTALGGEVVGFDLKHDLNAATAKAVNDAWGQYAVLCFRDQESLSPDEFVKLGKLFGDIQPQLATHDAYSVPGHPDVGTISSRHVDPQTGTKIKRGGSWHTDHSHAEEPPRGTMLHAIELPPSGGGETQFCDTRLAWDDLPDEMKTFLKDRKAHHVYLSSRAPRALPTLTEDEKHLEAGNWHPLARTHPLSGRIALYLNPMRIEHVEGMADDEAYALLDELLAHATQDKYQYHHVWKPGDVIIWDNRCTMHQATPIANPEELRFMHRIMIKGEGVY